MYGICYVFTVLLKIVLNVKIRTEQTENDSGHE